MTRHCRFAVIPAIAAAGRLRGSKRARAAAEWQRALTGFTVDAVAESGNKLTRFGPFSSQCRAGNVKILRGHWNEELFRVLEGFPDLAHDDEVDACSGALEMFNPQRNNYGIWEATRQLARELEQRNKPPPKQTVYNPARGSMEWQALQNKSS